MELRAELMHQHDPQSSLEAELVERLAGILWRLRRIPFFEAAILDARHKQRAENNRRQFVSYKDEKVEEMSDVEWRAYVGHALIQDSDLGDALGKLARHAATLMNGFTKTLQLLLLLQGNNARETAGPLVQGIDLKQKYGDAVQQLGSFCK